MPPDFHTHPYGRYPYGTVWIVQRRGPAAEVWVVTAHRLLVEVGPPAVTVEGVARSIGVTKGSFYWHFDNRAQLLSAALDRWEQEQTAALIDTTQAQGGAPTDRLGVLFGLVGERTGGLRGEAALYAAAPSDPVISAALTRVTRRRLDYVTGLLTESGVEPTGAADQARLALSIAIGQRALGLAVPDLAPDRAARERLTQAAVALFRPSAPTPTPTPGCDHQQAR